MVPYVHSHIITSIHFFDEKLVKNSDVFLIKINAIHL